MKLKLKKLSLFAFALIVAVAFSITGCEKEKPDKKEKEEEPPSKGPTIEFYSTGIFGDLYWTYQNRTVDPGVYLNFGIYLKHSKKVTKLELIKESIAGPTKGNSVTLFDTTLNSAYEVKTLVKEQLRVEGVVVSEIAQYTVRATDEDGNISEKSVEVSPAITVDQRSGSVWDREEDNAYDFVIGMSVNKSEAKPTHDIELAKSGANGFKFISGNGSKFKLYSGTAVGLNRFATYDDIDKAWTSSGAEMTETPLLDEDSEDYNFILIKSSQNQRVYVIQLYTVENDFVEFDYAGEVQ